MFARHRSRSPWFALLRPLVTRSLALLCALSLSLGALFVYLESEVREPDTTATDRAILQMVQTDTVSLPLVVPEDVSLLGSEVFVAGVALSFFLGLLLARRRDDALFVAVAIMGSATLTLAIKYLIRRPRPVTFFRVPEHGYSFPSGHTLSATCLAAVVGYLLWQSQWPRRAKWGGAVLLITCVAFVGAGRLVLGVHYPTDVAGSVILGSAWMTGLIAIDRGFSRGADTAAGKSAGK